MNCEKSRSSVLIQYAAATTGSLTALGYGLNLSWTSPVIPYLTSDKSHILITKNQGDLISSIFPLGLILGYLINPLIANRINRKHNLLIYSIPQIISWILIIFMNNITSILIGRILCGFGYGGGICALTVYLSEIGNLKNRGIFLVMIPTFLNLGFLFVTLLGAFASYNLLNTVMLLVPLIFMLVFIFMPDSSHFRKQDEQEKMVNLINYYETHKQELEKICLGSCNPPKTEDNEKGEKQYFSEFDTNSKVSSKSCGRLFKLKEMKLYKLVALSNNRRSLLILFTIAFSVTFSGAVPLIYNTQQLLSYSGFSIRAEECTIILAGITVVAFLACIQLVERIGRKVVLLYSGILSSISMSMVGMFFFLESQNIDVSYIRWVPLFGLTLYQIVSNFGFVALFYILQGELFPADVKSFAVTICKIFFSVLMVLSLVRFQEMIDILGLDVLFFMFAAIAAIGTYVILIITPETKGKSIEEIQLLLKSRNFF